MDSWSHRDLSLYGKIIVIKSLAVSKVVLPATVLLTPEGFIKRLNKVLFSFLWGKKDKVKRHKVIKKVKDGGLNMIDIESFFSSLKAQWMNRLLLCDPVNDRWSYLPLMYLKRLENLDIVKNVNFDEKYSFQDIEAILSFWLDVIKCYAKLNNIGKNDDFIRRNIFSQPLWGNRYICVRKNNKKEVLFLRNWIRSGIVFVKDLKFKNGVLDCEEIYKMVESKRNLLIEIQIVKKALLPFRHTLNGNAPINEFNDVENEFKNSKAIYESLIIHKSSYITTMSNQVEMFKKDDMECENVFRKKLTDIKENKLKEFNYKLMYNILPCNSYLIKMEKD